MELNQKITYNSSCTRAEGERDGKTFNEPLHIVEALAATVSQRQLYTHFTRRLNVCLSLINKNTNKHEYGE